MFVFHGNVRKRVWLKRNKFRNGRDQNGMTIQTGYQLRQI